MTTTTALTARKRDGTGKGVARKLRAAGRVPAVLYGGEGESVPLSVDAQEAMHLFTSISVDNTIVELEFEDEKTAVRTLVREIQTHPYKPELLHIDFLRIQKGVAVEMDVPIHLEGVPDGVRLHGGTLDQILHEVPVRCIPSKIPQEIVVDVSQMDVGDVLRVGDLDLGDGVEATIDPEQSVVLLSAQRGGMVGEGEEEAEAGEDGAPEASGDGAAESGDEG